MLEKINSVQMETFLKRFENRATVEIIEGAKQKDEIIKIAQAKGIDLKKNKDVSGFKCIYAFADRPNENNDYLPEKPLLKALPSIIGKPVNLRHDRRFVVGHILDYKYRQKEKQVIAYGVIYKSCFKDEWKALKKDFADKKLTVSFEIWSPQNKWKVRPDGVTELYDMTMAGMALLPRDTDPAFEGANVLSLARKKMEEEKELDLVYASKYKKEDIITADYFKEEIKKNVEALEKETKAKEEVKVEESKEKIEVPKVEEKVEPIEPETPLAPKEENKVEEVVTIPKVKCANCQEEFETAEIANIKCPKCFAIISRNGEMIYPPQIKDFRISCPSCKSENWLILSNSKEKSKLRCQNCAKEYELEFTVEKPNELLDKMRFVYIGRTSCIQCGYSISTSGISSATSKELTCEKCGLTFIHNEEKGKKDKQISKIAEVSKIETSSEKGGEEKVEKSDEKKKVEEKVEKPIEEVKKETPKEEIPKEEAPKEEVKEPKKEVEKVEAPKAENADVKASVEPIPQKGSEEIKEESEKESKVEESNEEQVPVEEIKKEETIEEPKKSDKNKVIRKAVSKILALKKSYKLATETAQEKEKSLKEGIKKVASLVISLKKEVAKIKKEADEKISLYKENAKTILKRREELGEEYAADLSDKDIMNEDKFELAKSQKEVTLLKASNENSDDIIGDNNDNYALDEELTKAAEEIDKKAFSKKTKKNKKR